jgi:hypothetical protein
MALVSPGVEVKVIDESFYTPAAPGTVPLIVVASAENKLNGAGDGIAPGTLKANAGKVYLMTSQRDLVDTFGDPVFKTDVNNNPIHAGEQNEYGLQAAYSVLGVSARAFVVRADLDLSQLDPKSEEPKSNPENGVHWLDTNSTRWGIFEWNNAPITTTGGQTFTLKTPITINNPNLVDPLTGGPKSSVGVKGSYSIVTVTSDGAVDSLTDNRPLTLWYKTTVSAGGVPIGSWVQVGSTDWVNNLTVDTGEVDGLGNPIFLAPDFTMAPHTQVPTWKGTNSAATGSIWVKTTEPAGGSRIRVKRYNTITESWDEVFAPLYANAQQAFFGLDRAGGGQNLAVGTLYVKYNTTEETNQIADFKIYRKRSSAPTIIRTGRFTTTTFTNNTDYRLVIVETIPGSTLTNTAIINFTITTASETDSEILAGLINSAEELSFVEASVDSQNRLVISHTNGGDIHFSQVELVPGRGVLDELGFQAYNPLTGAGILNLYDDLDGDHQYVASLWEPLVYVASEDAPKTLTQDGQLWYSSIVDEVDIMVHNGTTWVGYKNFAATENADDLGPFVQASAPESQRDGTILEDNDLWIDTSDLENFPTMYRWSKDLQKWLLIDKSDQSTDEGILFADARYGTSGETSFEAGSIEDLLVSNYLDPDAPDPALYPRGMLLWNLRRSGFNVKEFRLNYIDTTIDNVRFDGIGAGGAGEQMVNYYPHRWVTVSGNQGDGSGSFGRKAQRRVVVQALQSLVNRNQDIRDDESRIFNLMACPGYPELIGELISLNFDRGLTAFIVGDTPARLTSDATSLLAWGSNQNLAVEDNDVGAVSFDEYMGIFYPWGFTSDNAGNNVVVPPSHMILRTIINNDQLAYPWFAPAGIRRGGITNASSVGYINKEGEFVPVALNVGQRDTLYEQKINPITFITGTGLVNYGQKTRSRGFSSLDRINVARLVIYLRRQLSALAKPYIFEPNDKITRDEVKAAVETLLVELVGLRAIYDFLVVCDETNNTPARIDRNELWIDIAIEPVKAVEFIYIPLRLKNTGEISGLQ